MAHWSPSKQLASLQKNRLVRKATEDLTEKSYGDVEQIIPFLVSNDLVKKRSFYRSLAKAHHLDYYDTIPRSLDMRLAVVQQIPIDLLMAQTVYPLAVDDRLVLVTYTPFLQDSVIQRIKSYTRYSTVELAIANPILIRDMLEESHRQVADIVSAHETMVFNPDSSVQRYKIQPTGEKILIGFAVIAVVLTIVAFPIQALVLFFICVNLLYFIINPFKLWIFIASFFEQNTLTFSDKETFSIDDRDLPMYTILVPLRFEAVIVDQIVRNIASLDYPKDKLDVKFIINIDDTETIDAIHANGVGVPSPDARSTDFWAQVVEAPTDQYTTKPRVCNYALASARGMFTVIYDAEDQPDKLQIRKAYLGFYKSSLDTACIQCKLNFYNSHQNYLTRLFALEYGFWFEFFLPGLQKVASPIPLGGTSNHFITQSLKRLGTWDAYNVTEDADLGLRIARKHFRTRVLDSTTLEEANSSIPNWIRQRTRWQKGFLQTFLVHYSNPVTMMRELGWYQSIHAFVTFGSNFFLPLVNMFLYIIFFIFIVEVSLGVVIIEIPDWATWVANLNLFLGNLLYLIIHAVAAFKTKRYDLLPYVTIIPFYWILISIATMRAVYQYVFQPYTWEKTKHGLK